jgi:hypothetical protein
MKLASQRSFGKISNIAKILIFLVVINSLSGCQPLDTAPTSITPIVEVQVLTPSLLTETPIPPCMEFSDIELSVEKLSENSIYIRITGLVPNEAVHAIFSSKIEAQEREIVVSGSADEKGVFEYSVGLRGENVDVEFKDWQIRVVYSKGSTCAEVSLP